MDEAARVLSSTAQKLKGITQGQWTDRGRSQKGSGKGSPKRIADRKKTSACTMCGSVGHWMGDPECSGTKPKKAETVRARPHQVRFKHVVSEEERSQLNATQIAAAGNNADNEPPVNTFSYSDQNSFFILMNQLAPTS